MKIGRNQPCPCNSGKKFKRCCGSPSLGGARSRFSLDAEKLLQRQHADERIRQAQQGRGRPIISNWMADHAIVAVGSTVYWGKHWKTFPDFLAYYIKAKLGPAWGNAEIAKPLADRHPILQWYDAYCRYQHETILVPGQVSTSPTTGVVACYLGLAYGLYMLDHNVELQDRLIRRLKDPRNFQGAYYEIAVARILLRAGFSLALEDEADRASKHCEFSATSKSGKKYWVEARMRSIAGLLGKTALDGGTDGKPMKMLIPHLNGALAKPAPDERLIFIDLNTRRGLEGDVEHPTWLAAMVNRLEEYERKEMPPGVCAYLFVTNIAYHLQLDRPPVGSVLPLGLGIPDFMRPGELPIAEAYRRKLRHRDAHAIIESIRQDTMIPPTLDGSLPSVAFNGAKRVLIGETYNFEALGRTGTVTDASVDESKSEMLLRVSSGADAFIVRAPMSEAEMRDYRDHRDAYFGRITNSGKETNDPLEFFEWLMAANARRTRESILEELRPRPDYHRFETMTDEDLRIGYAELLTSAVLRQSARHSASQAAEIPKGPTPAR